MAEKMMVRPCGVIMITMTLVMLWASQAVAEPGGREKIPNAQNNTQLKGLATFAVQQYNSEKGLNLQYVRLVSAEQQVVSGIMYYLVIETGSGKHTAYYEAQVWVQAWRNFKSLESFKPVKKPASSDVELNV